MRVAVLSCSNRVVGGVEEYLRRFLAAAAHSGNEVVVADDRRIGSICSPYFGWSIAQRSLFAYTGTKDIAK